MHPKQLKPLTHKRVSNTDSKQLLKPAVKASESNNDPNKSVKIQEGSEKYKSVKYSRSSRPSTSKIELYECDDF